MIAISPSLEQWRPVRADTWPGYAGAGPEPGHGPALRTQAWAHHAGSSQEAGLELVHAGTAASWFAPGQSRTLLSGQGYTREGHTDSRQLPSFPGLSQPPADQAGPCMYVGTPPGQPPTPPPQPGPAPAQPASTQPALSTHPFHCFAY